MGLLVVGFRRCKVYRTKKERGEVKVIVHHFIPISVLFDWPQP